MPDPVLIVPVEKVAPWVGLDPLLLTNPQTAVITDAILDAQAKVEAFLLRPITNPVQVTRTGLYPDPAADLGDYAAWPDARVDDSVVRVVSYTPTVGLDGAYDVVFAAGIDATTDPEFTPIRTFVRQDAVATLMDSPVIPLSNRKIKSVSAEGQSVTYESAPQSPDAAGGALTVSALRKWKRYAVGQATARVDPRPWPYRAV